VAVGDVFTTEFVAALKGLVGRHHSIYPLIPPQGIYFESLVERAFLTAGWPRSEIILENPNSPKADIRVGAIRLSLKTETGAITRSGKISITKLCTTEKGEWSSVALIKHAISHLSRYDGILMLRAIWGDNEIVYQLVDIPTSLLQRMQSGNALGVGKRKGRRSLGFDVREREELLFHVHFDGADGKCQIRNLAVDRCIMVATWTHKIER
jgi:Type II site-specific deoxyribonuclease